jgi:hypothetical protein
MAKGRVDYHLCEVIDDNLQQYLCEIWGMSHCAGAVWLRGVTIIDSIQYIDFQYQLALFSPLAKLPDVDSTYRRFSGTKPMSPTATTDNSVKAIHLTGDAFFAISTKACRHLC